MRTFGDGPPGLSRGSIRSISVYYEKFKLVPAPGHSILEPVPGTSEVIEAISSEDVEKYRGGLQAYGYVFELDEVSVNPAKHKY